MDEGELEEIRRKKLEQKQKELEAKEAEEQLKDALRSALSGPAYDRLTNVAHANKELYLNTAQQVLYAYKRLGRRIDEKELLTVLKALKAKTDKEVSIKFLKK